MADIATKRLKLIESPLLDPNDTGQTLDPSPSQRDVNSRASDFRRLLHRLNPPKDAPRLKTVREMAIYPSYICTYIAMMED